MRGWGNSKGQSCLRCRACEGSERCSADQRCGRCDHWPFLVRAIRLEKTVRHQSLFDRGVLAFAELIELACLFFSSGASEQIQADVRKGLRFLIIEQANSALQPRRQVGH